MKITIGRNLSDGSTLSVTGPDSDSGMETSRELLDSVVAALEEDTPHRPIVITPITPTEREVLVEAGFEFRPFVTPIRHRNGRGLGS